MNKPALAFAACLATLAAYTGELSNVAQTSLGATAVTIEGNVSSPGDDTHKKAGHTVRMYIRDYDLNAEKIQQDLSLVPEEERTQEESALFSYKYTYNNEGLFIYDFLMPWIPEESSGT